MAKYEVKEEGDKLHVYVELPLPPKNATGPFKFEKISTTEVLKYLSRNNIDFGRLIKNGSAHNKFGDGKGHWIFRRKVLDKPKKKVIIVEEKSVQPKPKRARRTRSSTKKVSTEE